MFSDVHSAKINIPVSAGPGSNTVIAAQTSAYLYIHEIMGDLDVSGTLTIYCGSREQGSWSLDAGQGITLTDEPGNPGVPRFQCRPGEALVLVLSAGATFKGNIDYSLRQ